MKFTEQYDTITEKKAPSVEEIFTKQKAAYFKTTTEIKGKSGSFSGNKMIKVPKGTFGRLRKNTIYQQGGDIVAIGALFWLNGENVNIPLVQINLKLDVEIVDKGPKEFKVGAFGY